MAYLKSLLFNFLIVFFADYLLPGIEVTMPTKLPHIGGDLIFAVILGGLNSLIYPALKVFSKKSSTVFHIAIIASILNFGAYALLKLLPIAIHISSIEGYLLPAIAVTIVSFIVNFFEMKAHHHHHHNEPPFSP